MVKSNGHPETDLHRDPAERQLPCRQRHDPSGAEVELEHLRSVADKGHGEGRTGGKDHRRDHGAVQSGCRTGEGDVMARPTVDELIEAAKRAISDDLDDIAKYRKKIIDCQNHMKWAIKVLNNLKEEKENESASE